MKQGTRAGVTTAFEVAVSNVATTMLSDAKAQSTEENLAVCAGACPRSSWLQRQTQ